MGQTRTRSSSQYTFAQIPRADIPRSSFSRNHSHKTTFDSGYLIPVFVDEVLPGDTFNLKMDVFARLATPIFPIMDGMYIESFFFFVPNRIIWDNWKKFMGEQVNPGDSTSYILPKMASSNWAEGTIGDYLGIPVGKQDLFYTSLPFRAYNLIWNEWFRDENLQNSLTVLKTDGPDPAANYAIRKRGKRHDYFTSCLPWPQKGDAVEIPLSGNAPVISTGTGRPVFNRVGDGDTKTLSYNSSGYVYVPAGTGGYFTWNDPKLEADLSSVFAATINSLRTSFQIQKLLERDARGGTRYVEILRSHFGVESPDSRLQRPEYLGGGHSPLIINPVTQTSTTAGTPQGNMSGYGIVAGQGHGFIKSFTEHGFIIGMVCARGDISYQQGLHRMWSRSTKLDFYWPALAHLGEQAVLNKEIYAQGSSNVADDQVFGYQERWAEYRYGVSKITGLFRSSATGTLDSWHLAQNFVALPTLGETFIQEDPPVDRVIAVPSEPHFLFDSYFRVNCVRPMPVYSVPGLIDHF